MNATAAAAVQVRATAASPEMSRGTCEADFQPVNLHLSKSTRHRVCTWLPRPERGANPDTQPFTKVIYDNQPKIPHAPNLPPRHYFGGEKNGRRNRPRHPCARHAGLPVRSE
jgi:hypothetical protein